MWRARRDLALSTGREPSPDELATHLGLPVETIRRLGTLTSEPISTETPLGADGESKLGDFLEDAQAVSPVESAMEASAAAEVRRALAALTTRERRILHLRFGIEGHDEHTLEAVGKEYGVTRERIRQIEAKALARLRKAVDVGQLRSLLED
jgi:RNA polymerase primary sigma factor